MVERDPRQSHDLAKLVLHGMVGCQHYQADPGPRGDAFIHLERHVANGAETRTHFSLCLHQ